MAWNGKPDPGTEPVSACRPARLRSRRRLGNARQGVRGGSLVRSASSLLAAVEANRRNEHRNDRLWSAA